MADTLTKLEEEGVQWLRIYWCGYDSTVRCHVIPVTKVLDRLGNNQIVTVTITKAVLALSPGDGPILGLAEVGSYSLLPIWSSLRSGPIPGHLSCTGGFSKKSNFAPIKLCPRTILRTALETADSQLLQIRLRFELEFALKKQNPDTTSPEYRTSFRNDGHGRLTARGLFNWRRDVPFNFILDKGRLERGGIIVERLHVKVGPGNYAITLGELQALEACDTYLIARQIIASTAAQYGFQVTMHPKPFADLPNNAVQRRISVDPASARNSFFAGILTHLSALTAFTNASAVSSAGESDGH
jgi:glutamine synthetase